MLPHHFSLVASSSSFLPVKPLSDGVVVVVGVGVEVLLPYTFTILSGKNLIAAIHSLRSETLRS